MDNRQPQPQPQSQPQPQPQPATSGNSEQKFLANDAKEFMELKRLPDTKEDFVALFLHAFKNAKFEDFKSFTNDFENATPTQNAMIAFVEELEVMKSEAGLYCSPKNRFKYYACIEQYYNWTFRLPAVQRLPDFDPDDPTYGEFEAGQLLIPNEDDSAYCKAQDAVNFLGFVSGSRTVSYVSVVINSGGITQRDC
jgi:hypothetical protein